MSSVRSRILLIVVILAAEFAMVEATLRLEGGSEAAPAFQSLFLQDGQVGYRLKPNASTRYTTVEFSTDITINGQGVRDDREIGPKAPDERRIVVLGDSLVLSVQVPLAETFCKLLEARLNKADPAHRWRVINAGVQGYGPVDEWLFYRRVVEDFEPDLVLVAAFPGNANIASRNEGWLDADGPPPGIASAIAQTGIRRLVRSSMVVQLLGIRKQQFTAHFSGPAPEPPLATYLASPPPTVQHGLDVTRGALGKIAARAAERGARTAIILMPARFQTDDADYGRLAETVREAGGTLVRNAATERGRQALAPLGLPMFDLLPTLEAQPDRVGLYFQQNVHLTTRGHMVVAEAIFQFLETSGLVNHVATSPIAHGKSPVP
jgi:lysophospholipase L1-like esterase